MSWMDDEPVRGGYPTIEFLALAGIDRMQATQRHLMPRPPIHHLFGLEPLSASLDSSVFTMPASPWLLTSAGVFTAGTSALVADAPLGGAIIGPLGRGDIVVTSDLTLNYLRPSSPNSQRLIARARPVAVGKRLGLSEAVIEDGAGELVAHATSRCFIRHIDYPPDAEPKTYEDVVYETPDPHARPLTTGIVPPEVWAERSFLEILKAIDAGELPHAPFVELFGLTEVRAGEGHFETAMTAHAWLTSPAGTIYGGFLAYLADSVLTAAIATTVPANSVCAPLDLKVNFLRPVFPDRKKLVARATVVHRGQSLALAECEIVNAEGKAMVKATSSATFIEGRNWAPAVLDDTPVADASEVKA